MVRTNGKGISPMSWLTNLRLGTRLLAAFIGIVVIVGGIVGGLSYYNLMKTSDVIHEITDQRVPSVKNATAVERYALRTIMQEKLYLLSAYDSTGNSASIEKAAMDNIDQLIKSLDEVNKVATAYNDKDLLAKSQETRKATEQYKALYNPGRGQD